MVVIAGTVLTVLGKNTAAESEDMSPEQDFMQFPSLCKVTSVTYETNEKETKNGVPICEDIIKYQFTTPNSSQSYEAAAEIRKRCDCKCGESVRTWDGAFVLQESYYCWRPSGDRSAVPSAYRCGNDACYKLFDPADDKAALEGQASSMTGVAAVLLGMGISCMLLCCCALAVSSRRASGGPERQ